MNRKSTREFAVFETRHPAPGALGIHRHAAPYVALVMEGSYEEFSVDGVWTCEPGDLVVHPGWHLHVNRFERGRCRVLNFRRVFADLSSTVGAAGVWRIRNPDTLMRPRIDADMLADALADAEPRPARVPPAPVARLAAALGEGPERGVAILASRMGLSREHATRTFRRHLGLSPRAFRAERMLRTAMEGLRDTRSSLATVAFEAGYADQAHFTRCLHAATGLTPGEVRRRLASGREITFVQ
jgi:AraC family transcriptional regulator